MVSDPGVTQTISDRQWQAYIQVCYQRDRYREALERIANGYMHRGHICDACKCARLALEVEA